MPSYEVPDIPLLLTLSSLLYLMNVAEEIFVTLLEAGLLGSLATGIIYGPEAGNLLPEAISETILVLGYIGLVLLVFEAGMSTNLSLLYRNGTLSIIAGSTGIVLPIAFSLLLLHFGFGYPPLQSFAAGAALSSTSLGTTLTLLKPELKQTRMGVVLLSAALFDDAVGLVIAAIISDLSASSGNIRWQAIVRPILVSVAFTLGTAGLVWVLRPLQARLPNSAKRFIYQSRVQIFLIVATLSGAVASAKYAGTSELYGAYLAGVLLAQTFCSLPENNIPGAGSDENNVSLTLNSGGIYSPHLAFTVFFQPLLQHLFSPLFFVSIGASLPIRSLGSIDGSSRVVWRGWVYSLLMMVAKLLTGVWLFAWPDEQRGWCGVARRRATANPEAPISPEIGVPSLSAVRSAVVLGAAMVARGEIALIVAQLGKPIMAGDGQEASELFAVVIWGIVVNTVAGAVGVGLLLRGHNTK
ncbi:hypothetical protein V5O48_000372 [Marasmius crinis-equi]|uniref:Cation/H+ exchanger transmembrane domain-containing protein n=1 Tax=Marasmius crinis-equi TaxID=585013 RepID=A0ABR3G1E6_9AGAR